MILREKLLLIVKTLKLSSKLKIFIYNHTLKDPLYCTIYKHHYLQDRVVVGLVDVICEQRLSIRLGKILKHSDIQSYFC